MKKNKIHSPKTVCTDKAVQTIKDAAESKEDQTLYFEIKDADLIAREFKYHEHCYKEYARKEKSSFKQAGNELSRSLGDFDQVKKCIEEKILSQNQAILKTREYQCASYMIYTASILKIQDIAVN